MIINDNVTQPQRVELHIIQLERGNIDFNDKHTLYKLLPHYVKRIEKNKILFFNKYDEVIIDFVNDFFYIENFNTMNDEDFYKKAHNFEYIFIEFNMEDDILYFFNEKLTKKGIPTYLQKVKSFLLLLQKRYN